MAFFESDGNPGIEYTNWEGMFVWPMAIAGYLGMGAGMVIFAYVRARHRGKRLT